MERATELIISLLERMRIEIMFPRRPNSATPSWNMKYQANNKGHFNFSRRAKKIRNEALFLVILLLSNLFRYKNEKIKIS